MIRMDINFSGGGYPIVIGGNALAGAAAELAGLCPGKRAAVVSDENVWALHGGTLEGALRGAGVEFALVIVPPGEGSKSLAALGGLYDELSAFGLLRDEPVIAFGGGVVGDLAGFAAATYMRGVPLVQMPTSLLSQVDSSVGGKVAVNLEAGKNLVGSFYQPSLVIADTGVLDTLPEREWKAGMAEVIKYAAIGDADGGNAARGGLAGLLCGPTRAKKGVAEIVRLCCACKAGYVERDERDTAVRMMLNFGHTFGHAIEKRHRFMDYNHGEAVAVGMALAARTSVALGFMAAEDERELLGLLDAAGLDCRFRDDIADIVPLMAGDKKNSGKDLSLILLKGMGRPFLHKISQADLIDALRKGGVS